MGRARDLADKTAVTYATQAALNALPIRSEYVSPQQTITSGGALTLAHGLGVRPRIVRAFLVCQTAEQGFSIGDEVPIGDGLISPEASRGFVMRPDTTNIVIRFGSAANAFVVNNATTGSGAAGLTNANWRLVVRAYA